MLFPVILFSIIELYLWIWVLIPYFRYDQFQFWDNAGHFFAAWFQKTYLFPNISGWNPFFFGGYPQGTFYGPLYHYLIALLGFPLGLPLAFKLVTIPSVAILPFSIYYLARKFEFNPNESSVITFLAMIPIAGLGLACGGTLFSQFGVGLGPHTFSLPLFLFYFGKLKEQTTKMMREEIQFVSPLNFALLTGLIIMIALVHFVVAFAAAVIALILIFNSFNKNVLVFALKHTAIAFLVCAFFLLPLLAYGGLTESSNTIFSMGFFLTIPLFLLILLGGAASLLDQDQRFDRSYFMLTASFAIIAFLDFGQIGLPMHAYRFIIFFMLLAMMLPIKMLFNKIQNKGLKVSLLIVFFVLLGWQLNIMVFNNPRAEINYNRIFIYKDSSIPYHLNPNLEKVEGRILLLESSPSPLAPRALEHLLARTTGNYFLKGLFAESSAHASYLMALHSKVTKLFAAGERADWSFRLNVRKLLDLFQINYILSETPIRNAALIKRVPIRSDRPDLPAGRQDFYLYRIGESKIAQAITYEPYIRNDNWRGAAWHWFESPDPRILVKTDALSKIIASPEDTIEVIEEEISPPSLKLKVSSKENIPILIKMSYFPRWKAYSEGKPTKIYRVAPSLMLIYGKGDVRLEYKATLIDRLGMILTFLGLAWFLFEVYPRREK